MSFQPKLERHSEAKIFEKGGLRIENIKWEGGNTFDVRKSLIVAQMLDG